MSESGIIIADKWGDEVGRFSTSSVSTPEAWLIEMLGGQTTTSGVRINRQNALAVSALWKGMMLICTAVAKSPMHIYAVDGNSRTINRRHPAYQLVRHKPNYFQRAYDFRMLLTADLILTGNAYAVIEWSNNARPKQMLPVNPQDVQVYYTPRGVFYDATIYYDNGEYEIRRGLDQSQMLHLTWMPSGPVMGTGIVYNAREILGQCIAMMRYAGSFFENSARPDIVIKHPGRFGDPQARANFREDWKRAYGGPANARGVAVLDEAMDVTVLSQNARDSQFAEIWTQTVREVANFLGLPPSKLGDTSRTAYNSLEQDQLATVSDCFDGFLVNWEEAINEKLLSDAEQRTGSAESGFDRTGLLATDLKTKAEYLSKALGNNTAWITVNDARVQVGLNPVEGGDVVPTNGTPPAPTPEEPEEPDTPDTPDDSPTDDQLDQALRAVVLDTVRRTTRRMLHDASREHAKGGVSAASAMLTARAPLWAEMTGATDAVLASRGKALKLGAVIYSGICQALLDSSDGPPEEFSARLDAREDNLIKETMRYVYAD